MKKKLVVLGLAVGAGYLFGTQAGREKLDVLKAKLEPIWQNPRVRRARKDVEEYTRQQAPVIRKRAETAAKNVADTVTTTAKDVVHKTTTTAKDVADKTVTTAKDVADKTVTTAKDVADKTVTTAKDVVQKTATTAKDVADKTATTAKDVAADIRDRGEAVIDGAVISAGEARERALEVLDDEDDEVDTTQHLDIDDDEPAKK